MLGAFAHFLPYAVFMPLPFYPFFPLPFFALNDFVIALVDKVHGKKQTTIDSYTATTGWW